MSNSKRSSSSPKNDNEAVLTSAVDGNNLSKSPPNSDSNKGSGRSSTPGNEEVESPGAASPKREETKIPNSHDDSDNVAQTSTPKRVSMKTERAENVVVADAVLETTEQQHSTKQCRLEYFRSGIDADCEVHVPQNGEQQASEKLEQDVFQNKQWNGILQINGVSPESVEIFLEYIYTFEVTSSLVDLRIIGDIYILSTAYNMPEFLHTFSKRLKDIDWPLEDIFPAFNLAFQHNLPELENACLEKILNKAQELKMQSNIMKLQIYAFNYLIQHWMVTEAVTTNELIHLLQEYQRENDLNFKNTKQFPHFTKIVKYFPDVLLDAEGIINIVS
ncbi:uncharacterized protein LOC117792558 isoform X2 [Drosophila innubila]|uniref:uncharacterized protein LOC117792558 isoform X2 n=1 Tax=Drosophila innubila TaxID=198719 RepID=UPI00148C7D65|nr:uncharacterized protein LOC117792558 isoform X2 [Drosophila innubila]